MNQKAAFSRLASLVADLCDGRPVYYMPNPGNWGDALIRYGTHKFFRDIDINYTELQPWADVQSNIPAGSVLIYGGGGAWCRLWQWGKIILEPIQHLFGHVIVLPSTYEFSYSLPNATFFCRDRYESRANMPEAVFCHDMAFYLEPVSVGPAQLESGYFFRTDAESANRRPIPAENNDIGLKGTHYSDVKPFFQAIAKFEVVHTDRLHVAIAACLLGRELHFYSGSYFKNRAVFDSSMRGCYEDVYFHHDDRETQQPRRAPAAARGSPTVSVIIPTYQRAHWVTEAIESVLAQTYADYEIIVVNDGSTDNTRAVLAQYRDQIHAIHQENQGLSAARNAAIRAARGKYIALLDDDDLWLPHKLEKQIPLLEAHPDVGLLFSDTYYYYGPGAVAGATYAQEIGIPAQKTAQTLFTKNYINVPTAVVRRACFDEIGLFDETLTACEDYDLWLRIVERWRIEYLDAVTANYRVSDSNMHWDEERMLVNLIRVKEKAFARNPNLRRMAQSDLDVHFYGYYVNIGIFYLQRQRLDEARQIMARYLELRGETFTYQHLMARIEAADQAAVDAAQAGGKPSPKISVIMPVYNAETVIGRAIESIQTQTFPDWELIVVDNGSTDDTPKIVERCQEQDDRIRLTIENESGLAAARERGFALAQGEYIYCLDAGRRSLPDALQRLYRQLKADPHAVAAFGAPAEASPNRNPLAILAQLGDEHFLNAGAIAMRRDALEDALSLVESPAADKAVWWLLLAGGGDLTFVGGAPLSEHF